jgi:hypothetical protein
MKTDCQRKVHSDDHSRLTDDGGNNSKEEHSQVGSLFASDECNTVLGETQKVTGSSGNETENVVSDTGSEHKETDNVLGKHTDNNSSPVDVSAVSTGSPECKEDDGETKQADGSVGSGVVLGLFRRKGSDQDGGNGNEGTSDRSESLWHHVVHGDGSVLPNPLDGLRDVSDGNVVGDESDHDG